MSPWTTSGRCNRSSQPRGTPTTVRSFHARWATSSGGSRAPVRARIFRAASGSGTDDDQPVGWGWIKPPSYLEWFVRVDLAPDRQRSIREGIIGWLDQAVSAGNADAAGDRPPARPTAWAADGWPEADDLRDRGFVPAGTVLTQFRPIGRSFGPGAASAAGLRRPRTDRPVGDSGPGRSPSGGLRSVEDDR